MKLLRNILEREWRESGIDIQNNNNNVDCYKMVSNDSNPYNSIVMNFLTPELGIILQCYRSQCLLNIYIYKYYIYYMYIYIHIY